MERIKSLEAINSRARNQTPREILELLSDLEAEERRARALIRAIDRMRVDTEPWQ
jgi:hypothetical protein